jgi:C-terminal processing protease CtpA/Prc
MNPNRIRRLFPSICVFGICGLGVPFFAPLSAQGQAASASGAAATPAVDRLGTDDVQAAVDDIKQDFVRPEALSDSDIERATLQGLLGRLAPEVALVTASGAGEQGATFYTQEIDGKTGYLRPGPLTEEDVDKAREALKAWAAKNFGAVVLDLRGTPPDNDFTAAADLTGLFTAKGTEMFSLYARAAGRPAASGAAELSGTADTQAFTAQSDPVFKGVLVVLVDGETGQAPEAVAAALRICAKALVVGDQTAGRGFEYRDFPLHGAELSVAVARIILPDGTEPGALGLKPDIEVAPGAASKAEIMQSISTKGIASVTEEHDRPHLNEAALVAGSNPEVDELEAESSGKKPEEGMIDPQLQRALDLVTSITIYQAKSAGG